MNEPIGLPLAPNWALTVGSLGRDLVWSGLVFFVLSLILWAAQRKVNALELPAKWSFTAGALSLIGAFACLTSLFVKNQFEFEYVFDHGSADTSLSYKVAGVWTAQQGSFLLWAVTASLCALVAVRSSGEYRRWFTMTYASVLGTLSGILAYETPFKILKDVVAHNKTFVPIDGAGMTPSLQNYWVVIHPPTIFVGFGALTIFFAYAVAAMMTGNYTDWAKLARPWALGITGLLGLGISMGGLWAYETQGWGGFWMWDPVENVSFVPWLILVGFAHGLMVQISRKRWTPSNLLLAGLPFLTFVYGTFLTRSGLLDKVSNHSFVSMDQSARGILRTYLIAVTVAYVALWIWKGLKAPRPENTEEVTGAERESLFRYGVMLISLLGIVISIGMSWPVITALRGGEGSKVEEWLYHQVVVWFFIPLMVLMAITPFAGWRAISWKELGNKLFSVTCISLGITGVTQLAVTSKAFGGGMEAGAPVAGPFNTHLPLGLVMSLLTFLCVFVAVANSVKAYQLAKVSKMGAGGMVAHIGLAILMGGLILSRGYEHKSQIYVRRDSPQTALGYTVTFKKRTGTDLYDREGKVLFDVTGPDGSKFEARPGLYKYGPEEDPKDMVWPHIERFPTHDVYMSMAAPTVAVWPEPQTLKAGETKIFDNIMVEYVKPDFQGSPGTAGFTMGAQVRVTLTDEATKEKHQYLVTPNLKITQGEMERNMPRIGRDFRMALVMMSPKDRSAQLVLLFDPPVYPIELFYKPMTGLIWLGTGILFIGGLMAAFARRVTVSRPARAVKPQQTPADAPLPAS